MDGRAHQRGAASVRDALDLPELGDRAVDRRLLLADDRGAGQHPSTHAHGGAAAPGSATRIAHQVGALPPVSSLFSAVLGENPVRHLLEPSGALASLSAVHRQVLTGRKFFPSLISGPFHHGLTIVFLAATILSVLAAFASLLRGGRPAAAPPAVIHATPPV